MSLPVLLSPPGTEAARLTATILLAYAGGTWLHTIRGFRVQLEDRWSSFACASVMTALAVAMWSWGPSQLPRPVAWAILLCFLAGAFFTVTYTLSRFEARIHAFRDRFGKRLGNLLDDVLPQERLKALKEIRAKADFGHEGRRKTPHLLSGFYLVIYAGLGHVVMAALAASWTPWVFLTDQDWLLQGHVLAMMAYFLVLGVIAPTELLRMRYPELSYPFKQVILSRLRARETGLFGAHYYLSATLPLCAMVLMQRLEWKPAVFAMCAVVAVSVFADSASALVGMRWGKTKWFHNPRKSYIGSLAGIVVAVLVAAPLVGWPLGLLAAAAFLFIDVLAPYPLAISDNILNPLGMSAVFLAFPERIAPLLPA